MYTHTPIDFLKRRGFIITEKDGRYFLSDDAHPDDAKYLSEILQQSKCGTLQPDREILILDPEVDLSWLFNMIPKGSVGVGSCSRTHNWRIVKNHFYTPKIPVRWLEPNIAYYIKALSACGIFTGGCCDGNHPDSKLLYIEFDGPIYQQFHKLIWEIQLNKLFSIHWNPDYAGIKLKNRKDVYEQLYAAAAYLYFHAGYYSYIRRSSAKWITRRTEHHMAKQEITEKFLSEAERMLSK